MVRISSTGELIHDSPSPNGMKNRSSNGGVKIGTLSSLSNSGGQHRSQSKGGFGTIAAIRTDNTPNVSGNYNPDQGGGGSSAGGGGRSVFGGHSSSNEHARQMGDAENGNLFMALNQKLLNLGIPKVPLGPITVEPIVLAGFTLSYLIFGARGLIFSGVLYGIHQYTNLRSH